MDLKEATLHSQEVTLNLQDILLNNNQDTLHIPHIKTMELTLQQQTVTVEVVPLPPAQATQILLRIQCTPLPLVAVMLVTQIPLLIPQQLSPLIKDQEQEPLQLTI